MLCKPFINQIFIVKLQLIFIILCKWPRSCLTLLLFFLDTPARNTQPCSHRTYTHALVYREVSDREHCTVNNSCNQAPQWVRGSVPCSGASRECPGGELAHLQLHTNPPVPKPSPYRLSYCRPNDNDKYCVVDAVNIIWTAIIKLNLYNFLINVLQRIVT